MPTFKLFIAIWICLCLVISAITGIETQSENDLMIVHMQNLLAEIEKSGHVDDKELDVLDEPLKTLIKYIGSGGHDPAKMEQLKRSVKFTRGTIDKAMERVKQIIRNYLKKKTM